MKILVRFDSETEPILRPYLEIRLEEIQETLATWRNKTKDQKLDIIHQKIERTPHFRVSHILDVMEVFTTVLWSK